MSDPSEATPRLIIAEAAHGVTFWREPGGDPVEAMLLTTYVRVDIADDMLEALKAVADYCDPDMDKHLLPKITGPMKKVRAAIAKAEGTNE